MSLSNIIRLLGCIIFCLLVGGLGGGATSGEIGTWYITIKKPEWNPPNWLFGPVWTTLYALMGVALYLVWNDKDSNVVQKKIGIVAFMAQLSLNFLWSFIFFKWHEMGWALTEMIFLWVAIVINIVLFYKIRKLAAYILIPYLSWVSFATFLTFTIWQLN
jgi:benzodiazapine receptor